MLRILPMFRDKLKPAFKQAFPMTLPVLTGYLVLGAAFGMLMDSINYSWGWTLLASLTTYAGSMQFVAVGLLSAGFSPVNTAIMTLMVNARHVFYGLSMLKKFEGLGKLRLYLIFGLTDETFSLLSTQEVPAGVEAKYFIFAVTLLNHLYWISGSVLGNIIGSALKIETRGMEFALTALFMVIFIEQWFQVSKHWPALMGIAVSLLALLIFGPNHFIIPAMLLILAMIAFVYRFSARERGEIK